MDKAKVQIQGGGRLGGSGQQGGHSTQDQKAQPEQELAVGTTDNENLSVKRHVPHALSVSRIIFSVVILVLASDFTRTTFLIAVSLLGLALFSDWADGYLARRWGLSSEAGYVLDAMGDRAIHLALILVVFLRFDIHPIIIWLLVFRDILIYAVRLLTYDWLLKSRHLQWLSRLHATLLRVWLCSYLVRDGLILFWGRDVPAAERFQLAQTALVLLTIGLSYLGLIKSLGWIAGQGSGTEPAPE